MKKQKYFDTDYIINLNYINFNFNAVCKIFISQKMLALLKDSLCVHLLNQNV